MQERSRSRPPQVRDGPVNSSLQLSNVRPLAVSGPRFFERRRSAPEVGHCVVSMPPVLGRRYRGREPLASYRDLIGLAAPSYALSCR